MSEMVMGVFSDVVGGSCGISFLKLRGNPEASLVKEWSLWDRSWFSGTILNSTVCSRESAQIFLGKKTLIPAVSVTWHVVSLQDGGIHVVNVELNSYYLRRTCSNVWYQKY